MTTRSRIQAVVLSGRMRQGLQLGRRPVLDLAIEPDLGRGPVRRHDGAGVQ